MMDEPMQSYLKSLPISDAVVGRIEYVYEMFEFLCPEKINFIFVGDSPESSPSHREFESLVAFSETFWLQARQFVTNDNADISLYANSVWYVGIESKELKLAGPDSDLSSLVVEVETGSDLYTRLFATGANCRQLLSLTGKCLLPNLRRE